MLRTIIAMFLLLHGIIHVVGFVNEWQIKKFKNFRGLSGIALPPALLKTFGLLWLTACSLFITAATMFYLKNDFWWQVALLATFLSQLLVIIYWPDAKAGTPVNLLIFLLAMTGYSNYRFNNLVKQEVTSLFKNQTTHDTTIITEDMLSDLPYPVHNWLSRCGITGKENIHCARLMQEVGMRLKPRSEKWIPAFAIQYITTSEPAFIWQVKMIMAPFIPVNGRDKSVNGQGNMLLKAFAAFEIADESGPKINEGSLQRYLAEICWVPSAALNKYIQWQGIDSNHADATIHYKGTSGTVHFTFDNHGQVSSCSAERYRDNEPGSGKEIWVVNTIKSGVKNGIIIPLESSVTWKLKEGDFTWFKLNITDIAYNIPGIYP